MLQLPDDPNLSASGRVIEAVYRAITGGRLKTGDKLPSRQDLARQLDVNPTTVGHAYKQLEAQGIVTSQRGSGTFIRDCEAARARRRRSRSLHTIRLVIGNREPSGCPHNILRVVVDVVDGLRSVLPDNVRIEYAESFNHDSLADLPQDSAVLVIRARHIDATVLPELTQRDIPVISVWGDLRELVVPSLGYDPLLAVRLACNHLIDCGYQRIGYLGVMGGTGGSADIAPKFLAFTDALFRANMDYQVRHVREVNTYAAGAAALAVMDIVRQGDLPDAFFVDTDEKAIEVLHALRSAGIDCPGEIGVLGYNDIPEASLCEPALSTIHLPRREAGVRTADMLNLWLSGADELPSGSLVPKLIVRDSTGPFNPSSARAMPHTTKESSTDDARE